MVTMILISIIATFAVLSLRGHNTSEQLAAEARRLTTLLDMARQEALLRGEQRGVHFTKTGYAFLTLKGKDQWLPLGDSILQQEYHLPAGFSLQLWVEDRRVDFARTPANLPQVLLLSSGENTAFTVVFSDTEDNRYDRKSYQVAGDPMGRLQAEPVR
jgi:general secretion pathway protein H